MLRRAAATNVRTMTDEEIKAHDRQRHLFYKQTGLCISQFQPPGLRFRSYRRKTVKYSYFPFASVHL